jgi:hypothetical protein
MPRNVLELARTFPALREIDGVASARQRTVEIPSAQELRRRAATALRDLMQRLADQGPLVLFIDDLQWGDLDSGVLLNEVLRPPEPPPLMLLVCYRSEDAERSPLLRALQEARATWASAGDLVDVEVGELAPEEARARPGLAAGTVRGAELAETIARDSAGHPSS